MTAVKVGVQLWPQHCDVGALRSAWRRADDFGIDSLWIWDHFFPLLGDQSGGEREGWHFEGWTLLAAMAADTSRASVGTLVTSAAYRNPDLLADMARTVDHISGGRAYLGVGAGWFEPDYEAYGYEFGDGPERLRGLEAALVRIRERIPNLVPPPVGRLPILVGGSGEKVTLRLVAQYADAWNTYGPIDHWSQKNAVLDEWCERIGRDPSEIERTVAFNDPAELDGVEAFIEAGATHVIYGCGAPFDLSPGERLKIRLA